MANGQFITLENGKQTLKQAPAVSTGTAQASQLIQTDANGLIDPSFLPTGIGDDSSTKPAGEDLSAGDYVAVVAGEFVKADATNPARPAIGFVQDAFLTGVPATVFHEGNNTSVTGLVSGTRYYLDAMGAVTDVATTTDGTIHQFLGIACDATTLITEIGDCILLDLA